MVEVNPADDWRVEHEHQRDSDEDNGYREHGHGSGRHGFSPFAPIVGPVQLATMNLQQRA